MECTVRWTSGMTFLAETGSGHVAAMDGAPDGGGHEVLEEGGLAGAAVADEDDVTDALGWDDFQRLDPQCSM